MQVFAVFGVADLDRVKAGIDQLYGGNYHEVSADVRFAATDGETTRQLATKIGLGDDNETGGTSGIVIPVASYRGRYSSLLREWISVEQSSNGG